MFFCSHILKQLDIEYDLGMVDDDMAEDRETEEILLGSSEKRLLSAVEFEQIHTFILHNSKILSPWLHRYNMEKAAVRGRAQRAFPKFHRYLLSKIEEVNRLREEGLDTADFPTIEGDVPYLVRGPLPECMTHKHMWAQGRHFRVKVVDDKKIRTCDSGISTDFLTTWRSSGADKNLEAVALPYFGSVRKIVQIDFGPFQNVILLCEWYKVSAIPYSL
jgi:hypothetical protein